MQAKKPRIAIGSMATSRPVESGAATGGGKLYHLAKRAQFAVITLLKTPSCLTPGLAHLSAVIVYCPGCRSLRSEINISCFALRNSHSHLQ